MRKHLGSFYCTYLQSYMCTYACLGVEIIRDFSSVQFSSVQLLSCVQQLGSLRPHGLQHSSLLCPSPALRTRSNSCPSSWWCHPTVSSSIVPFSSCLQSFPASGSFPMSRFFGFSFFLGLNMCRFRINLITGFGANYLWPRLSCWISPLQGSNWMALGRFVLNKL